LAFTYFVIFNGHLVCIVRGNLAYFLPFWYLFCTKKNLATPHLTREQMELAQTSAEQKKTRLPFLFWVNAGNAHYHQGSVSYYAHLGGCEAPFFADADPNFGGIKVYYICTIPRSQLPCV
jgi:hypothetical protein